MHLRFIVLNNTKKRMELRCGSILSYFMRSENLSYASAALAATFASM